MSIYKSSSLAMIPSAYKDGKLYSVRPVEQLGSELVTNGDFSSASDWTFSGGGVAISGGKLNFTATTREATQSISVVNTKTYRVSYEVSNYSAGSVRAEIGSSVGISRTANGIYSEYIVASGTNVIQIDAVSVFTGSIDNVSVKEVLVANGDFDFSRGTTATRVASSGYIEKGRENVLLNSVWNGIGTNVPPTSWTNGFTSGNYESASSSFGGNNGIRFYGTSARRYVSQIPSFSGIMALSIYVESVTTADEIRYVLNQIGGTELFYLEDSSVVANTTSILAGKTYTLVFNTSGTTEIRIGGGVTGSRTYDFTLSVPQLEQGLVRTDYIETGASTAQAGILEDMPRLDYSGGASCPALLLEPQRTNLITNSEYIEGISSANVVLTPNAAISPEGVKNAYQIDDNSTNSEHKIEQAISSTTGVHSVFVKSNGATYVQLVGVGTSWYQNFNIVDGTTESGNALSADVEDYGNGWYRIWAYDGNPNSKFQLNIVTAANSNRVQQYAGDGSRSLFVWGLQLEAGSYPTSYIPTYGSSVTRSVDVCDGAGDADLFNDSQGVLFAEVSFARDRGKSSPFKVDRISLSDGTSNNRILISNTTTANQIQVFIRNSSGTIFNETITLTDITANNKIAVRYESGNYALYINGTQEATGSSSNVPSGLNELMFDGPSGTYNFEGKVKQAIYFPTALTDTELASLTTL